MRQARPDSQFATRTIAAWREQREGGDYGESPGYGRRVMCFDSPRTIEVPDRIDMHRPCDRSRIRKPRSYGRSGCLDAGRDTFPVAAPQVQDVTHRAVGDGASQCRGTQRAHAVPERTSALQSTHDEVRGASADDPASHGGPISPALGRARKARSAAREHVLSANPEVASLAARHATDGIAGARCFVASVLPALDAALWVI